MTESPDPASAWWALLTPEVRKFWFQRITGWSVEGAMKAAFAEATGEMEETVPAEASVDVMLLAALKDGLSLVEGWREAIVELEDWCHEPVRLADQLDQWAKAARAAIRKATGEASDG